MFSFFPGPHSPEPSGKLSANQSQQPPSPLILSHHSPWKVPWPTALTVNTLNMTGYHHKLATALQLSLGKGAASPKVPGSQAGWHPPSCSTIRTSLRCMPSHSSWGHLFIYWSGHVGRSWAPVCPWARIRPKMVNNDTVSLSIQLSLTSSTHQPWALTVSLHLLSMSSPHQSFTLHWAPLFQCTLHAHRYFSSILHILMHCLSSPGQTCNWINPTVIFFCSYAKHC